MDGAQADQDIESMVESFKERLEPLESGDAVLVLTDNRTGARYCECHVKAAKLNELGTTDVPLDPNHPDYRANRQLTDDDAFEAMRQDALDRRSFSNIVAEYIPSDGDERPLKIIGGQHRFTAIEQALKSGVDELHGLKVYFGLNMTQRLDVSAYLKYEHHRIRSIVGSPEGNVSRTQSARLVPRRWTIPARPGFRRHESTRWPVNS